jgi:sugar phosphate isomerase/epimerase
MAIPIGVQLYSVREDAAANLPGVLAAIKGMGYEAVEFAGYYGFSAEEIRRLLDDNGLKCCGSHVGIQTLMPDVIAATIDFNQTIGNKYLIVPGLPHEFTFSRDAWLHTADTMNQIADTVAPFGMVTGYHNHTIEFQPLDGELPWDTFFGNTKPEVVMQFDTGNAMHGGADAPPFLERYPGRAKTVHLKEYSKGDKGYEVLIGEGDIPWDRIFQLCETSAGTEWYIVEQEGADYPPMECIDRCLQNLRKMGK